MLKKIAVGLLVVIVLFLGYAATRPDTFHVERSATIAAPPEVVFSEVADFHKWAEWSPWDKRDPAMKRDYQGGPGPGAVYKWEGNDQVGQGQMTLIAARPPEQIDIKLDFIKPFEGHNQVMFTFKPSGPGTLVVWAMDGKSNFMGKVMSVFMNMNMLIGKDFEEGLANLKRVSEAEAVKVAAAKAAAAKATQEEAAKKAAEAAAAAAAVAPPPAPAPKGKKK